MEDVVAAAAGDSAAATAGPADTSATVAVKQESPDYRFLFEWDQQSFQYIQTSLKRCIAILKPCLTGESDSAARNAIMELEAMNYRASKLSAATAKLEAMDYRVECELLEKKIYAFHVKLTKPIVVVVNSPHLLSMDLSPEEQKALIDLDIMTGPRRPLRYYS